MKRATLLSLIIFMATFGILSVAILFPERNNVANTPNSNISSKVFHINSPDVDFNKLNFRSGNTIPKNTLTVDEVSTHNSTDDCYLIINNNVYDVSSYINYHPGGAGVIISRCGKEVTGIFASIHSNRAWDLLKRYKVGKVGTAYFDKKTTVSQLLDMLSKALQKANPSATVVKVKPKANFYVAKVIYGNKLYEVHINSKGKIFKEEVESDEANWSMWESDNDDSR